MSASVVVEPRIKKGKGKLKLPNRDLLNNFEWFSPPKLRDKQEARKLSILTDLMSFTVFIP